MCRQPDNGNGRTFVGRLLLTNHHRCSYAIHAGQADVHEDQADITPIAFDSLFSGFNTFAFIAELQNLFAREQSDYRIIFDYQNDHDHSSVALGSSVSKGRSNQKVEPLPGSLSTPILPPISSTRF